MRFLDAAGSGIREFPEENADRDTCGRGWTAHNVILGQRGDRHPGPAERPRAAHLLRVAFYGGAGLPGAHGLDCSSALLSILYAVATIRRAGAQEKPVEHGRPDAPRCRTDSSLHPGMSTREPNADHLWSLTIPAASTGPN